MADERQHEEALKALSLGVQNAAKRGDNSSYEYGHERINEELGKWVEASVKRKFSG